MKIKLIIIILFILISINVEARDAQELYIESEKTLILDIKGITKYLVLNPDVIKVQINNDNIIITGFIPGSTPLYLWKKDEFIPYIVNTSLAKPRQNIFYENKIKNNDSIYGFYNIHSSSGLSINEKNSSNNNQLLSHSFFYKMPFNDGNLLFQTNLTNKILNYVNLDNIFLENILLSYNSKNLFIDIGDTNISSSSIQSFNNRFRGIKINYSQSPTSGVSIFSGIEQQPLFLYNTRDKIKQNLTLINGFTGKYNHPENIVNFSTDLISKISPNDNTTNKINLSMDSNWQPIKNLSLAGNFATDFNSAGFDTRSLYRYIWNKTGEWVETENEYRYFAKNFINSNEQSFYSSCLRMHHISDTLFYTNYNILLDGISNNSNISFNASKSINKFYSLYGATSINNSKSERSNNYEIGNSLNFLLPIDLNYSYSQGNRKDSFNYYRHNFKGSVNLVNKGDIQLFIYSYWNLNEISDILNASLKKTSLNESLNLILNYNFSNDFNFGGTLGFNSVVPDLSFQQRNNSIVARLTSSFIFKPYHKLNFDLSLNNNIGSNNADINFSLGYTSSFGSSIGDNYPVGSIKGLVFEDKNGNNIYDQGEKIIKNVRVTIKNKESITNDKGFEFNNLKYGSYEVSVDHDSLPEGYKIVTPLTEVVELNTKSQELYFGLNNFINIRGIIYGNNKKTEGLSDIKVFLDDNESTFTDIEGSFSFKTKAGKHKIKLDYTSFPTNYSLSDKLAKDLDLSKDDVFMKFIFKPLIIVKGVVFKNIDKTNKFNSLSKIIPNATLEIRNITENKIIKSTIKTDENGAFLLRDLEEGKLEISSLIFNKIVLDIPNNSLDINIEIPISNLNNYTK